MHHMNAFEYTAGCAILLLAIIFIVVLIGIGLKLAADARIEEAEKNVERKAERLARQMVKERLEGTQLQVIQRVIVIEDDLGK